MSGIAPWRCPNCGTPCDTAFCPICGEKPPADLTLRGVALRALEMATSIDGQLIRSFARLLRRPGFLTAAYVAGSRTPYLSPLKIFLVANAFFFAVQSLTGENIFSSTLDSHLHQQDWSALARTLVAEHLQRRHTTLAAYAPVFDAAVVLHAKSLIILMVAPFAALLPAFYARAHKPLMAHTAFALHLYTFLLLTFSASLLAARVVSALGGGGLEAPWLDKTLAVANLLACAGYLYAASGPAYGASGIARIAKAALLGACAGAIVVGYRFALLLVTLAVT